ncbi:MAG: hypothetical protein ABIH23_08975 [bacterium]
MTIPLTGFVQQALLVGKGEGMHPLPVVEYPGRILMQSPDDVRKAVEILVPEIEKALTEPIEPHVESVVEPGPREIVFTGSLEEINEYFYEHQWSDGLPIVPPTIGNVEEFLKYTDRSPEERIGVLKPGMGEATIWNIAVNGVMAGCRPEYMPILVTIVEVMADPQFGIEHAGSTPGWEALIILNGPIRKQLGFNCETGVFRPGCRPNISIGRFFRLYMRNVPGYLPAGTDKATFGQNFRPVLAENEEALAEIGWESLSVERGFNADDNVVTISSCRHMSDPFKTTGYLAEQHLARMAGLMVKNQTYVWVARGPVAPTLLITPVTATKLSMDGYKKEDIRKYIYQYSKVPAYLFDKELQIERLEETACKDVEEGILPPHFCESDDPNRLLPILHGHTPDDLLIVVSGDPNRNRNMICQGNGKQGYATSKKIELPSNWEALISALGKQKEVPIVIENPLLNQTDHTRRKP